MALNRQVLSVFLASPNDLADERRAAKTVFDEFLTVTRGRNIAYELLGWEDTLPGGQRPQELINRDLDQADLFVGLLWRRWGQPTGSPEFSSGFEEEFSRAWSRHQQTGSPEIWLFFKEVDQLSLQDAGEQLKCVLAFRRRCESEKRVFFKEFKTTDDWQNVLRLDLIRHLIDNMSTAVDEPVENRLQTPNSLLVRAAANASGPDGAASLMPVLDFLQTLAKGTGTEVLGLTGAELHSARLYLIGLSLLSWRGTSTDLAGTHEINTLFRLRNAFEPMPLERTLIQRSVLADRADVKPGWYWFPRGKGEQIATIYRAALTDPNSDVRKGAFKLMTDARIRDGERPNELFDAGMVTNQPVDVQDAIWRYLESIVDASDRDSIHAMIAAGANPSKAQSLLLIARSAGAPAEVLAEAATMPDQPSERLLILLRPSLSDIDQAVLIAAFSSRHDSIREMIASELFQRHLFDEIRAAAQNDTSEAIRILEYRDRLYTAMQTGGERPAVPDNIALVPRDRLVVERLQGLSYDDLQRRVDWLSLDGPIAYEVLATDYWDEMSSQIRDDAATDFLGVRQRSIDRYVQTQAQSYPDGTSVQLIRTAVEAVIKPDIDILLQRRFAGAALAGIERHGSQEDAPLARKHLRSTSEQDVAIRALARVGDESDVPELMHIAAKGYGESRLAAATLAYKLSRDSNAIVQALLQSSDAYLVGIALSKMEVNEDTTLLTTAIDLLKREDLSVRDIAIEVIIRLANREQLLNVCDAYLSGHYYYNVVVALDRALNCTILSRGGAATVGDRKPSRHA